MIEDDEKTLSAEINQLFARLQQAKRSKRKLQALASELGISDTANATFDDVDRLAVKRGEALAERLGRLRIDPQPIIPEDDDTTPQGYGRAEEDEALRLVYNAVSLPCDIDAFAKQYRELDHIEDFARSYCIGGQSDQPSPIEAVHQLVDWLADSDLVCRRSLPHADQLAIGLRYIQIYLNLDEDDLVDEALRQAELEGSDRDSLQRKIAMLWDIDRRVFQRRDSGMDDAGDIVATVLARRSKFPSELITPGNMAWLAHKLVGAQWHRVMREAPVDPDAP